MRRTRLRMPCSRIKSSAGDTSTALWFAAVASLSGCDFSWESKLSGPLTAVAASRALLLVRNRLRVVLGHIRILLGTAYDFDSHLAIQYVAPNPTRASRSNRYSHEIIRRQ